MTKDVEEWVCQFVLTSGTWHIWLHCTLVIPFLRHQCLQYCQLPKLPREVHAEVRDGVDLLHGQPYPKSWPASGTPVISNGNATRTLRMASNFSGICTQSRAAMILQEHQMGVAFQHVRGPVLTNISCFSNLHEAATALKILPTYAYIRTFLYLHYAVL